MTTVSGNAVVGGVNYPVSADITLPSAPPASVNQVSQGPLATSGSPSFGQATQAHNFLVARVACNNGGSSNPITTTKAGWVQATSGGQPFGWFATWYKPNCSANETPPVFSTGGASTVFSRLAEFSGVALSVPVDQQKTTNNINQNQWVAALPASDAQAGDLLVGMAYWNGSNAGGSIILNQFTDSTGNPVVATPSNYINGTQYFSTIWGVGSNTGTSHDTLSMSCSEFNAGNGSLVAFRPAVSQPSTLTINPVTLPNDQATTPYPTTQLTASGGTPPYSWSISSGALPAGMSLSSSGVISGTPTTAGTYNFTVHVSDSASHAATWNASIVISSAPGGTLTNTGTGNNSLGPYNYPPINESPVFGGSNTWVRQNIFNPTPLTQVTYAYDPGNWWTVANCQSQAGEVLSGPDVQQVYYTGTETVAPLSHYDTISSTWSITPPGTSPDPAVFGYEYNFDLWIGDANISGNGIFEATEIMVWTYTVNQTPWQELSNPGTGNVTIAGIDYFFSYHLGTQSNGLPRGPFNFVQANATSGTTDLKAILQWLMDHGYLGGTAGGANRVYTPSLNIIEFGIEICSTGGVDRTFAVDSFSLTTTPTWGP